MKMNRVFSALIATVALAASGCTTLGQQSGIATGQHAYSFEKEIRTAAKLNYLMYAPKDYPTAQEKWPLMLFLHGGGEKGDNLEIVKKNGPPKLVAEKEFPFIIVSPQCPGNGRWSDPAQIVALNALVDDLVGRYPIDEQRIYLTGLSMGGFGTWSLAAAYPDKFAAIVPICGGGNTRDARKLADLPIWVFHGAKDSVIPIERSQEMVDALERAGGNVKFTVYPEANHNSWTATYTNPELYTWLLQQTRSK